MPLHLHEESGNMVLNYRANIDFESNSTVTIGEIPLGGIVTMVIVKVLTAFNGSPQPTLNIGISGNDTKYADYTSIPIDTVGTHIIHLYEREIADINAIATLDVTSSTAGTAEILLEYATA